MNATKIFDYSWGWNHRIIIRIVLSCMGMLALFSIGGNLNDIVADPLPFLFFGGLICIPNIWALRNERKTAKQIVVNGQTVKITSYNNVTIFDMSEISKIKRLDKKHTKNSFHVKEIVVKVHGKSDCVIPINISNFRSLYKSLKRRNSNVALPLSSKPTMDESDKKDPKKSFIFYLGATFFLVWVGLGIHKESKNIWLYGDVSKGIIKDSNIPCGEPKIEVQGVMYKISNCEDYPENVSLNVISMPDTKVKSVYVGVKGSSLNEFIKKRSGKMLAGVSLFSLLMFSVSLVYLRKWRKKT